MHMSTPQPQPGTYYTVEATNGTAYSNDGTWVPKSRARKFITLKAADDKARELGGTVPGEGVCAVYYGEAGAQLVTPF